MLSKRILNHGAFPLILIIATLLDSLLAQITIDNPHELAEKFNYEKIKANFANFGKVSYGHNLIGRLHYDLKNKESDYACSALNTTAYNFQAFPNDFQIVMVDRGNCNFVTKARNVQKIGGLFALIINNEDDDIDQLVMADDGTGADIYIPTVMITKKDGEIIEKFMRDSRNNFHDIVLNVEFEMPQKSKVDFKLFFSSSTLEIYSLLKSFKPYQKKLLNWTNFEPTYLTHKSSNYDAKHPIPLQNCVSKGLYCEFPSFRLSISDGKETVFENIRQKCIFMISKGKFKSNLFIEQPVNDLLYWNYMEAFHDRCINNTKIRFDSICSSESQRAVGINEFVVHECFLSSFSNENKTNEKEDFNSNVNNNSNNDKTNNDRNENEINFDFENKNSLLEQEEKTKRKWKIKDFPTVIVSNKTLQGALSAENLLEAVCAGLSLKPGTCAQAGFKIAERENAYSESVSILYYLLTAALVFAFVYFLVYFVCKKYVANIVYERIGKGDIDNKINNVVSNYFALKEPQIA